MIDFDGVTSDPNTGELKAEYQPNSSTGGPGDKLHPNRAGFIVPMLDGAAGLAQFTVDKARSPKVRSSRRRAIGSNLRGSGSSRR